MTDSEPDDATAETNGRLPVSRREIVGTLAAAGVLGATASAATSDSTNAAIGGGEMATQIEDLQIDYHVGTFSERPSAGVEGRVFEVFDPPSGKNHGAVYYDDGTSWSLADRQFGSVILEDTGGG